MRVRLRVGVGGGCLSTLSIVHHICEPFKLLEPQLRTWGGSVTHAPPEVTAMAPVSSRATSLLSLWPYDQLTWEGSSVPTGIAMSCAPAALL